jgi:hypothetical protein
MATCEDRRAWSLVYTALGEALSLRLSPQTRRRLRSRALAAHLARQPPLTLVEHEFGDRPELYDPKEA